MSLIKIDKSVEKEFFDRVRKVFSSGFLSEGKAVKEFEKKFSNCTDLESSAVANGGLALQAIFEYVGVQGKEVVVPTNTFVATPLAAQRAGARVVFADCNKYDLCLSVKDLEKRITRNTKAVCVVHIGGHIAFDILEIRKLCRKKRIFLVEDCAHAHGATFHGGSAGSFGIAGAYSFYATKTMTTGEGGMVVSKNKKIIQYVNKARNYGKFDYKIKGFNYRMNEITACLAIAQINNLPKVLDFKRKLACKYDKIFADRVYFPKGLKSGYYKYIVFNTRLKAKTGTVYDKLCHKIFKQRDSFPNSEWVAKNHSCPPIYYGYEFAHLGIDELKSRLQAGMR